jgi:hypothetical protein
MAQAHDLLTLRAWTGANLTDVVMRALDAVAPAQVEMSGAAIDVSKALRQPVTGRARCSRLGR